VIIDNEARDLIMMLVGRLHPTEDQDLVTVALHKITDHRPPPTSEQERLLHHVHGIEEQVRKGHFLNVHFRAFELAHESWREHVRQNAVIGSRRYNSPGGAVLDPERDGSFPKENDR